MDYVLLSLVILLISVVLRVKEGRGLCGLCSTVNNSLYCELPRDRELVFLIASVHIWGNLLQSNISNLFLLGI